MIGASNWHQRLAWQEVPPKSRPTPCTASIVLIHLYIGDTIRPCLGVPCQPRQWTRNRHAPRQVRDDSVSCLNDGGIQEHNRVDARRLPVPWFLWSSWYYWIAPHIDDKKGTNKNSKVDIGTKYNRSEHSAGPDGWNGSFLFPTNESMEWVYPTPGSLKILT